MVLIGILNTRLPIGIGRLITNSIFGPLAFLFLAIAGLILIEIPQFFEESSQNNLTIFRRMLTSGMMYIIGSSIIAYNVIIYNLDVSIMFFTASIGILWLFLVLFAVQWKVNGYIGNIILSLAFSIGVIFGGILNVLMLPIFIYFFFLAAFFLQLSRELLREFNAIKDEEDKNENDEALETSTNNNVDLKILKVSFIFQLMAIVFFLLPVFTDIINPFLFLYFMIPGIILISIATVFTLKSILNARYSTKISVLLKIGILIEIIAFILAA